MGTLVHFKRIFDQAFDGCKPEIAVVFLKAYAAFSAIMLIMALYALMYRAFTGFEF